MITITIPTPLRRFCGNQHAVEVDATTLEQAFDALGNDHHELVQRIMTADKKIRPFVNVFVGNEDCRNLAGMATPLTNGQKITIMSAFAGG